MTSSSEVVLFTTGLSSSVKPTFMSSKSYHKFARSIKNGNKRRKNNFEPRRIEETFRESPSHQLHLLSTQHHESALCTCTNTSFKVLMHFSKSTHALTCTSSPSLTPSVFVLLPPLAKSQPNWRKFERIHWWRHWWGCLVVTRGSRWVSNSSTALCN